MTDSSIVYLKTKSNLDVLQKENKLKGMAMEELISYISDKVFSGTQETLKNLRNKAGPYLSRLFRVNKDFRIISGSFSKEYSKQYNSLFEYDLVFNLEEIEKTEYRLQLPKKRKSMYLGYKKCKNCGNKLPETTCKKCDGVITEDADNLISLKFKLKNKDKNKLSYRERRFMKITEGMFWCNCDSPNRKYILTTKKCKHCNSGYFNKMKTSVKRKEWRTEISDKSKKELFLYLKENDFISDYSFSNVISSKRVDFWGDEGAIQIYESKNKEVTGLELGDVLQACYYAIALKKSGVDADSVYVVYNGDNNVKLSNVVNNISEDFNLDINLVPIGKWIEENRFYVDRLVIGKGIKGIETTKDGKYGVKVYKSDEFKEDIPLVIES